ncbi:hypothetical protein [Parvularcula sp. IMCC14364]|uniref:hypothetical protein n=1 Tax=Parvularcula sp. IMCC14364 TaxID=3067902 RepID=UPI0027421377|nr:hypothetical protein [Parvularcula sp. IMCC14364]
MFRTERSIPAVPVFGFLVSTTLIILFSWLGESPNVGTLKLDILNVFLIAAVAVNGLFILADRDIPRRFKGLVRQWFLPKENLVRINSGEVFYTIFVGVYGRNHFSLRCLIASILSSTIFFAIFVGSGVLVATPENSASIIALLRDEPSTILVEYLLPNIVADFFALWQTRYFLRLIKDYPIWTIPLIILDVLITLVIFFLAIAFFTAMINEENVITALSPAALEITYYTELSALNDRQGPEVGTITRANYLTTYVTSVWLWLVLGLGPILRGLFWRKSGETPLGIAFRVSEYPMIAFGFAISLTILGFGILTWLGSLFLV